MNNSVYSTYSIYGRYIAQLKSVAISIEILKSYYIYTYSASCYSSIIAKYTCARARVIARGARYIVFFIVVVARSCNFTCCMLCVGCILLVGWCWGWGGRGERE